MSYDVVIPAGRKDVARVGQCVDSLAFLDPQPDTVTVVTPDPLMVPSLGRVGVRVLRDADVFDFERVGPQPNWVFQQFVKLFQDVTANDAYMTVDADLVFLKPFKVFAADGRPVFWRFPLATLYEGSFRFMEDAWGMGRVLPFSTVCHMMMFDKGITREMLGDFVRRHPCPEGLGAVEHLYRYAAEGSCERWCIGDYDTYPNYVEARHSGRYDFGVVVGFDLNCYCEVSPEFVDNVRREAVERFSADVMVVHCRVSEDSF